MQKAFTKTKKSCPKLKKSSFQYFLIRILIEESIPQNQNLAKSWKNEFFNTLIRIWIEKACTKTKILPKAEKLIFQYFFN